MRFRNECMGTGIAQAPLKHTQSHLCHSKQLGVLRLRKLHFSLRGCHHLHPGDHLLHLGAAQQHQLEQADAGCSSAAWRTIDCLKPARHGIQLLFDAPQYPIPPESAPSSVCGPGSPPCAPSTPEAQLHTHAQSPSQSKKPWTDGQTQTPGPGPRRGQGDGDKNAAIGMGMGTLMELWGDGTGAQASGWADALEDAPGFAVDVGPCPLLFESGGSI